MEQKEEKTLTNYSEILKKINNWEKWKDWFKESSLSNKPTPIWPPQQFGEKNPIKLGIKFSEKEKGHIEQ